MLCDQSALKSLNISEENLIFFFFYVIGHKIFILNDVPHLSKRVRNNFIETCFQKKKLKH